MKDVQRHVWCLLILLVGCDIATFLGGSDPVDRGALGTLGGYRDADTLVIGRATDAAALDPALPTDSESAEVIEQIFDTLVYSRPGTSVVDPGLAIKWTAEDGGRSWVFELRKGVKFHDGTPLNADAVVFSLQRQQDPQHRYHRPDEFKYWKNYFANVQKVEKVDDYRVRIVIERPYAPFLTNMGIFSVGIVSPTAVSQYNDESIDDFTRNPVGTGPFKFVSWESGRIVLERNDEYWDKDKVPRFKQIVFQEIPDPRQRLVALQSGAIDIAYGILPEETQLVSLHPRLRLHTSPVNSVTYLALNNDYPPFHDARVRRAVNYAINKEPIVHVLWQGLADVAESPLPPAQWGNYDVREPYGYDPGRARALLDEAHGDGSFDFNRVYKLYVPSTPRPYLPNPERLGRAIQANLRDVGLKTEMIVQPFSEHKDSIMWGEHDMCIYGWVGDNGDPDNFLYLLLGKNNAQVGRSSNVAFFRDPEVQGLLTLAQESESQNERVSLYARAQALIHEQAPWVPLAHSKMVLAARDDIEGISIRPFGFMRYEALYRRPANTAAVELSGAFATGRR